LLCGAPLVAQAQAYGPPITLEQARTVYAAAEAEAQKNKWAVAIAILDSTCTLVLFQKMDNVQLAAPSVAQDKAWAACGYKRSTKALQDALAKGAEGWRYLQFNRMVAADGGEPILVDGRIIGSIGISGVAGHQDGQIARVAVGALK
jgi:uncharacterized protein GlcG (DUF336 family)